MPLPADYLVPGCQVAAGREQVCPTPSPDCDLTADTVIPTDIPDMDRVMSLFLYKREEESAHDVIQQLLTASQDLRLFRLTGNQNMERIVKMDKVTDQSTSMSYRSKI